MEAGPLLSKDGVVELLDVGTLADSVLEIELRLSEELDIVAAETEVAGSEKVADELLKERESNFPVDAVTLTELEVPRKLVVLYVGNCALEILLLVVTSRTGTANSSKL